MVERQKKDFEKEKEHQRSYEEAERRHAKIIEEMRETQNMDEKRIYDRLI